MKRMIPLLLTVVLLLGMATMMTGCGDKTRILGTWKADADYAEAFNLGIRSADGMDELSKYFTVEEFIVTTTLVFRDDGSYTMTIDEEAAQKAVSSVRTIIYDGFEKMIQHQIDMLGLHVSVSEYMKLQGTTITAMVDSAFTEEVRKELVDEMVNPHTGNYKLEDGKIYMTEDISEELTEDSYDTYELDGDTLTLLECFCQIDAEQKEAQKSLYPMVFTRVED